MSVVDFPDSPINKISVKKSSKPVKMNNKPQKRQMELPPKVMEQIILKNDVPDELKIGAKGLVIKSMSLPAKDTAPIFYKKLTTSKFINEYLDRYLMIEQIAELNDHIKFGLCYLYNLFESKMIAEQLKSMPINIDEQSKQQPTK